jgi:Ni/Co efflux regulator RcnB
VGPLPPRPSQFYHRGGWFGRIRGPAYAYPRGWHYRRWAIGLRLPPLLFGPSYYYGGWSALGLEEPLPGYSWVRYGPDLLLVNLHTGEVEDVVYGVFY